MLEIPESHTISRQLDETIKGKTILNVCANSFPHKFAFFFGDPAGYHSLLSEKRINGAHAVAGQIEIAAQDARILLADGVNVRFLAPGETVPSKHQLLIEFDDESALVCTVQMYGGLWAYPEGKNENPYYKVAKEKPSPLSEEFDKAYFEGLLRASRPNLSAKAFLATEQRIPGLGNGVLQDILFRAGIHPKNKISTISDAQREKLFRSVKDTLFEMTAKGGRDTEKDLFGCPGGYKTLLSAKTLQKPCPVCGGKLVRQAYLGGNVYFCPNCQPFVG